MRNHEIPRMRYKLIQSKFLDKDAMWAPFEKELRDFDITYEALKPLIIEQKHSNTSAKHSQWNAFL